MLNVLSYNLNGIRAAIKKGLFEWCNAGQWDVLAFQEIKATEDQIEEDTLVKNGYHRYFNSAQKKGYAGTAFYSKFKPDEVIYGIGDELVDQEGRVLSLLFGNLLIVNAYFPSGSSSPEKQANKIHFLKVFQDWLQLQQVNFEKVIVLGDFNICHTELDIHQPKMSSKTPGYTPEERNWMTNLLHENWVDVFRVFYPQKIQFSWWSYRTAARARNKGWRIDYALVNKGLQKNVKTVRYLDEAIHSDHCPLELSINHSVFV